jgi:hypothetical protein
MVGASQVMEERPNDQNVGGAAVKSAVPNAVGMSGNSAFPRAIGTNRRDDLDRAQPKPSETSVEEVCEGSEEEVESEDEDESDSEEDSSAEDDDAPRRGLLNSKLLGVYAGGASPAAPNASPVAPHQLRPEVDAPEAPALKSPFAPVAVISPFGIK